MIKSFLSVKVCPFWKHDFDLQRHWKDSSKELPLILCDLCCNSLDQVQSKKESIHFEQRCCNVIKYDSVQCKLSLCQLLDIIFFGN